MYCKNSKNWDTCPIIVQKGNGLVLQYSCPKGADGMANSVVPDQTAPKRSSLIWVCTVCLDLYDPVLRIFMVVSLYLWPPCSWWKPYSILIQINAPNEINAWSKASLGKIWQLHISQKVGELFIREGAIF